jgi:hypothetical protein
VNLQTADFFGLPPGRCVVVRLLRQSRIPHYRLPPGLQRQPVHRLHTGLRQPGVRAGPYVRGKLWGVYGWEDLPEWKLWLRPAGIGWLPQWRHLVARFLRRARRVDHRMHLRL